MYFQGNKSLLQLIFEIERPINYFNYTTLKYGFCKKSLRKKRYFCEDKSVQLLKVTSEVTSYKIHTLEISLVSRIRDVFPAETATTTGTERGHSVALSVSSGRQPHILLIWGHNSNLIRPAMGFLRFSNNLYRNLLSKNLLLHAFLALWGWFLGCNSLHNLECPK